MGIVDLLCAKVRYEKQVGQRWVHEWVREYRWDGKGDKGKPGQERGYMSSLYLGQTGDTSSIKDKDKTWINILENILPTDNSLCPGTR